MIAAIRPTLMTRLKEEQEQSMKSTKSGGSKKKAPTKDVIKDALFDVSMFMLPVPQRHCIMMKDRTFTLPFTGESNEIDADEDEDVKPVLHTAYNGFEIRGKMLCLVIKPSSSSIVRMSSKSKDKESDSGSSMTTRVTGLEDWVERATQADVYQVSSGEE